MCFFKLVNDKYTLLHYQLILVPVCSVHFTGSFSEKMQSSEKRKKKKNSVKLVTWPCTPRRKCMKTEISSDSTLCSAESSISFLTATECRYPGITHCTISGGRPIIMQLRAILIWSTASMLDSICFVIC